MLKLKTRTVGIISMQHNLTAVCNWLLPMLMNGQVKVS
jgi:hypothetical protein